MSGAIPNPQRPPVVIVHGVIDASRPDEQDTLDQVRDVAAVLVRSGHRVETLELSLDLTQLETVAHGTIVFNLVEALAGDGRLIHLPAAVMEHLGLPFTGSGSAALALTTDKVLTKRLLHAAGIPTPAGAGLSPAGDSAARFIVKSVSEDASFGIDAKSVVTAAEVEAALAERACRFGGDWFAEQFIDGREFNLSIIEDAVGKPQVLPIAEITFEGFKPGRPRIVDYEAKWEQGSFAYTHTPRRFLAQGEDVALAADLRRLALASWHLLGLGGYGRIDFRVDRDNRCYVLEANANPCLSGDAGFAAAAQAAGMSYDDMIGQIVERARRRGLPQPIA